MKGIKYRILAVLTAVFMLFTCGISYGADKKAPLSKSVRLSSYKGSISVAKGEKALSKITSDMRLFDGYVIKTAADSYAFLELDDSKFVKIDQSSSIKIQKKGKSNTLLIQSGGLFFNVTKPLTEDESLQVRTTNVTMGVRGTTGAVSSKPVYDSRGTLKNTVIDAQIYTGLGYLTMTNNQTGEESAMEIEPGSHVKVTADVATANTKVEKAALSPDGFDIPAVAQGELIKSPEIMKQIGEVTKLDTSLLVKNYEGKQAREDQQAKQDTLRVDAYIKGSEQAPPVAVAYPKNQPIIGKEYTGSGAKTPATPEPPKIDAGDENKGSDSGKSKPKPPVVPIKPIEPPTVPPPDPDPDEPTDPDDPIDPDEPTDPRSPEASVGDTKYKLFADALAAAKSGDTILLRKNIRLTSNTTIGEGINLSFGENVRLTIYAPLQIDGNLDINKNGKLTSSIAGKLVFGANGTISLVDDTRTKLLSHDDTPIASNSDVKGKTFYYMGKDNEKAVWKNFDDAYENSNFDNIAPGQFVYIPKNTTTRTPSDTTWKNEGTLLLQGKLLGAENSLHSYLYCAKGSTLIVSSDSNIYLPDGSEPMLGKYRFENGFLANWNPATNRWVQCTGALLKDKAYSLEEALKAATEDTIRLVGCDADSNIVLENKNILAAGVTLEIDNPIAKVQIISGGKLTNNGTIVVNSGAENQLSVLKGGNITNASGGSITIKSGDVNIGNNGTLLNDSDSIGITVNGGNLNIEDGGNFSNKNDLVTANSGGINIKNGGNFSNDVGRITMNGGSMNIKNDGTLTNSASASITVKSGNLNIENGGNFANNVASISMQGGNADIGGNLTNNGGSIIAYNGITNIKSGGTLLNSSSGTISIETSTGFNIEDGGTLKNTESGTITVPASGTLNVKANGKIIHENENTITINGTLNIAENGTVENSGSIMIEGPVSGIDRILPLSDTNSALGFSASATISDQSFTTFFKADGSTLITIASDLIGNFKGSKIGTSQGKWIKQQ